MNWWSFFSKSSEDVVEEVLNKPKPLEPLERHCLDKTLSGEYIWSVYSDPEQCWERTGWKVDLPDGNFLFYCRTGIGSCQLQLKNSEDTLERTYGYCVEKKDILYQAITTQYHESDEYKKQIADAQEKKLAVKKKREEALRALGLDELI